MSVSTLVRAAAALIGGLALQPAAHAIPIGDFSWNEHNEAECEAGLCGAYFSVANFSDASFFDIFVDVQTDTVLSSLSLGEVASGAASQSIDDLFGLSLLSATLRLTFAAGPIQLLDFDGNPVAGLTAPGSLLIDFSAATSVPEPPTALLFAVGLLALGLGRKARQHTPATSRMKSPPAFET